VMMEASLVRTEDRVLATSRNGKVI
jgi:hypothetical protein